MYAGATASGRQERRKFGTQMTRQGVGAAQMTVPAQVGDEGGNVGEGSGGGEDSGGEDSGGEEGGSEDSGGEEGGSEGSGGEGGGGDRDDGGAAPPCLPVRLGFALSLQTNNVLAFAGWDAHGGELPYRRLHTDVGIERPRAMRAWWGSRPGLRLGGGGGRSAPAVQPAGGPSVRQLDLPDRLSEGHGTDGERGQLLTGRAFESQQGEEHGPGGARDAHGSTEGRDDQAGAGPGQRARAGFEALRELALGSIEAGRLGLMRLFTGEHAAAGHAGAATAQEQVELEEDEAQAVQDGDGQQQQRGDGDGGGDEEHERDDLHWSEGAEERQHDIERARDEREDLQVGEGGVTERNAARDEVAGGRWIGSGAGFSWGEDSLRGGSGGFGHRFAAAWARLRAAFGDG